MNVQKIDDSWGSIYTFDSPIDFFNNSKEFWRNELYGRKLLIFKKMTFTNENYIRFCTYFGKLWEREEYRNNEEILYKVTIGNKSFYATMYNNLLTKRMNHDSMPWHTDIPNRPINPYPIRNLWKLTDTPKEFGTTTWLNIEDGLNELPSDLLNLAKTMKIKMQGDYYLVPQGTNQNIVDFIKYHKITNKPSLRLDWFNDPSVNRLNAWINSVIVDDIEINDCKQVLNLFFNNLENNNKMIYEHYWDTFDIAIYDNWSLVHKRSTLVPLIGKQRRFFRTTINHLTDEEYKNYHQEIGSIFVN